MPPRYANETTGNYFESFNLGENDSIGGWNPEVNISSQTPKIPPHSMLKKGSKARNAQKGTKIEGDYGSKTTRTMGKTGMHFKSN